MKRHWFPILLVIAVAVFAAMRFLSPADPLQESASEAPAAWRGPGQYQVPVWSDSGKEIWYGRELIVHTAKYLGPEGSVAKFTNGMNCQNCHLDAGTLPYGNNFGKVASTYPQFRARSNSLQTVYGRINDCLKRSLNGRFMDSTGREMRAMRAYVDWLGEDVPAGVAPTGSGLARVRFLDRAADPSRGASIYVARCQSCHGINGEGKTNEDGGFEYPPLWGNRSYSDAAGMYRLSLLASFVKDNMPLGAEHSNPMLSVEEAWDVAAFIESKPRPHVDQSGDWTIISTKPVDLPFGPFADTFGAIRHKYGPFGPIVAFQKH